MTNQDDFTSPAGLLEQITTQRPARLVGLGRRRYHR